MDDAAIRTWIGTDHERVVRALTLICGDRQRAEDAVQDALLDVWGGRRQVDDLSAWVTRAALNRIRSGFRRVAAERRALERLASRAATSEPDAGDGGIDARVARALVVLPPSQREIVVLHYLLDLSVADVAARLGVVEGTVKTQLHRARASLRAAVGDPRSASVEEEDHV
jgi:RNA polymerase sigma-70 factor (ECF subfamily)